MFLLFSTHSSSLAFKCIAVFLTQCFLCLNLRQAGQIPSSLFISAVTHKHAPLTHTWMHTDSMVTNGSELGNYPLAAEATYVQS